MKMGFRTPSIKKSIAARTTGKFKRQVKKAINPYYGKKGMGWVNNPKKALYNKVYNKTTFGVSDLFKPGKTKTTPATSFTPSAPGAHPYSPSTYRVCGVIVKALAVCTGLVGLLCLFAGKFLVALVTLALAFGEWKLGATWSGWAVEDKKEAPEDLPLEADDLSDV